MSQETTTKWLQKQLKGKPFSLCDKIFGKKNERGEREKFAKHILELQRYCRVTFHLIIPEKYIKNNKFSGFIVTVTYDFEQLYDNDTYQIYLLSTKYCTTKTDLQLL